MNPTSPFTYYLRHKGRAFLQIVLISLATLGLFLLVAVLDTIPLRTQSSYLSRVSRVSPTGNSLDPGLVSQIQTHPDVEGVIPDNGLWISTPTLFGTDSLHILGISTNDAAVLMQQFGVRLKYGRMFEPRTNQIVLSEEVARALSLTLGDQIGREVDQTYFAAIPTNLVLVGILENDPNIKPGPSVRVGFISAEYLNNHEQYSPRKTSYLVSAKQGQKNTVDEYLELVIHSEYTQVETFGVLEKSYHLMRFAVYVIFGVINCIVATVMAFTVGIINRIALSQRLVEFGLLHALGREKQKLIRRLTLETASLAFIGCMVGLLAALTILSWLKGTYFYNLGMELDTFNMMPLLFVLPTPVIVVIFTRLSLKRIFGRLDAVAIIERGKLSEEDIGGKVVQHSSTNPLTSLTFYSRHKRRSILMVISTALMVLGITFPVFLFSAMTSAMLPTIDYLQKVSVVSPVQSEIDPGVIGRIRNHPAVERIIPVVPYSIQIILPPGGGADVNIFGVSEPDLTILMELYGLQIQEGRLPVSNKNEIVISADMAANRKLGLGDVIGGQVDPEEDLIWDDLPVEMVIVGILSPDRPWIGFVPLEYIRNHELTSSRLASLMVIPRAGKKQELDQWMQNTSQPSIGVNSMNIRVTTFSAEMREYEEMTTSTALAFAFLELMIAAVAAVALATLNNIFYTQRKTEFGILNAIGCSRYWLVWRSIKEMGVLVCGAWIIGALLCGMGLFVMQTMFYAPRGLTIDFFSLTPWLLTIPLPLVVLLASSGTVAFTLRRLDPVAVVERR